MRRCENCGGTERYASGQCKICQRLRLREVRRIKRLATREKPLSPGSYHATARAINLSWVGPETPANVGVSTYWQCNIAAEHLFKAAYGSVQKYKSCPLCRDGVGRLPFLRDFLFYDLVKRGLWPR